MPDYESAGAVWASLDEVAGPPPESPPESRPESPPESPPEGRAGCLPKSLPAPRCRGRNRQEVAVAAATRRQRQAGPLKLRGTEPLWWFPYVAAGGEIAPLDIPAEFLEDFHDVPF